MNPRDFKPRVRPAGCANFNRNRFPPWVPRRSLRSPVRLAPLHAVQGAVGRPRPVDDGENRIGNPFAHAVPAPVGRETMYLEREIVIAMSDRATLLRQPVLNTEVRNAGEFTHIVSHDGEIREIERVQQ